MICNFVVMKKLFYQRVLFSFGTAYSWWLCDEKCHCQKNWQKLHLCCTIWENQRSVSFEKSTSVYKLVLCNIQRNLDISTTFITKNKLDKNSMFSRQKFCPLRVCMILILSEQVTHHVRGILFARLLKTQKQFKWSNLDHLSWKNLEKTKKDSLQLNLLSTL